MSEINESKESEFPSDQEIINEIANILDENESNYLQLTVNALITKVSISFIGLNYLSNH